MPVSDTATLAARSVFAPLTESERREIMRHAPAMSAETRRLFGRLLLLAQPRGLTTEVIARAAAQAIAHTAGVSEEAASGQI